MGPMRNFVAGVLLVVGVVACTWGASGCKAAGKTAGRRIIDRMVHVVDRRLAHREAEATAQAAVDQLAVEVRACEIPGYPRLGDVASLGLDWCPGDVDLQVRAFALQAAIAWCAISGELSSAGRVATRRAEIREMCDRLDALGASSCQCPAGWP